MQIAHCALSSLYLPEFTSQISTPAFPFVRASFCATTWKCSSRIEMKQWMSRLTRAISQHWDALPDVVCFRSFSVSTCLKLSHEIVMVSAFFSVGFCGTTWKCSYYIAIVVVTLLKSMCLFNWLTITGMICWMSFAFCNILALEWANEDWHLHRTIYSYSKPVAVTLVKYHHTQWHLWGTISLSVKGLEVGT